MSDYFGGNSPPAAFHEHLIHNLHACPDILLDLLFYIADAELVDLFLLFLFRRLLLLGHISPFAGWLLILKCALKDPEYPVREVGDKRDGY